VGHNRRDLRAHRKKIVRPLALEIMRRRLDHQRDPILRVEGRDERPDQRRDFETRACG
jgi:hypothetical protein